MYFPEEPLDLPPSEGGGYYQAAIHQKLNGDMYEIVRKLGYGPRSSVWLILRLRDAKYFAVKIFTIAASEHAKSVELPILKTAHKIDFSLRLPVFHGSFWEKSGGGSHLCIVMNPLSTSVQSLQLSAENQRLPVHVVQEIVYNVAIALEGLHDFDIMHGAIKAENVLFSTVTETKFLKPVLDSQPAPTTTKVKKYVAIRSQPLTHGFKWNEKKNRVVEWPIHLDNLGHAQRWNYKPEKNGDYLSAPETLLQNSSCSPQLISGCWGIWQVARKISGDSPSYSKGSVSKRIATICAAVEDAVPNEWLSDSKMKGYNADAHGIVTPIEEGLSDALHKDDAAAAAAFIKACLRLDPQKRLTAAEVSGYEWLAKAHACSCVYSG